MKQVYVMNRSECGYTRDKRNDKSLESHVNLSFDKEKSDDVSTAYYHRGYAEIFKRENLTIYTFSIPPIATAVSKFYFNAEGRARKTTAVL